MENWEQGIPSGIHINLEDCYSSLAKAREAAEYVLPGHDGRVLEQNFYG